MSIILELERRYTHRFKASVPVVFCPANAQPAWGQSWGHSAKTINISECGVFFNTKHVVSVGLPVRVMINIPEQFNQRCARLFTGRVKHIEPKNFLPGSLGVGVEFFYSEPLTYELSETMRTFAALLQKAKRRANGQQIGEHAETMTALFQTKT